MKREGMPTQRLEERRVEEHPGVGGGGGERERESESERAHVGEKERKRFGSSFYIFFPPPGPALWKLGLARGAVCST